MAGRPRSRRPAAKAPPSDRCTLAVDIGGTGVKAAVLDAHGAMLTERLRAKTPVDSHPRVLIDTLATLVERLPPFDRIAVGFPGAVGAGRPLTAPNLRNEAWLGFDLVGALAERFGKPARISNDVALQGLAAITGKGVELVITLGTGFGTALYVEGLLVPQFALGHALFRKGETYDTQLNDAALERVGARKWNKRLRRALDELSTVVHFDRLYLGGGNARKITLDLDSRTTIISNEAGVRGGIILWA